VKLLITLFCENNLFYSIESYNNNIDFWLRTISKGSWRGPFLLGYQTGKMAEPCLLYSDATRALSADLSALGLWYSSRQVPNIALVNEASKVKAIRRDVHLGFKSRVPENPNTVLLNNQCYIQNTSDLCQMTNFNTLGA